MPIVLPLRVRPVRAGGGEALALIGRLLTVNFKHYMSTVDNAAA